MFRDGHLLINNLPRKSDSGRIELPLVLLEAFAFKVALINRYDDGPIKKELGKEASDLPSLLIILRVEISNEASMVLFVLEMELITKDPTYFSESKWLLIRLGLPHVVLHVPPGDGIDAVLLNIVGYHLHSVSMTLSLCTIFKQWVRVILLSRKGPHLLQLLKVSR